MEVLILDLTHGGEVLARRFARQGHQVTAVDVYGLCSNEALASLRADGISAERSPPEREFDLLVSPVHCPDALVLPARCRERRSFHEAVGGFIDGTAFRIEVTGVKAKTSSCHLLAHILNRHGRTVLLQTSRGRELWSADGKEQLQRELSINPTSLLTVPETGAEVVVAEVSLGGSGSADIGVLTDGGDYPIAAGTRSAREAKASVLTARGRNLLPMGHHLAADAGVGAVEHHGQRLTLHETPPLGQGQKATLHLSEDVDLTLDGSYVGAAYRSAIEVAVAAALMMGVDERTVCDALSSFPGVPGRGEMHAHGEGHYILERNPGISLPSILHLLDSLPACSRPVVLVPADRKVCESLDIDAIRDAVERRGMSLVVDQEGQGMEPSLLADKHGAAVLLQKEAYR